MTRNENEDTDPEEDVRSSNFTEAVSLIFVTLVLLFLSLKILLF